MKTHKPVPMRTATWYRTSLALGLTTLALVSLLQGCGGNAGVTTLGGDTTPTVDEAKRNSILTNTPAGPTQLQGLYKGKLLNTTDEFLILVATDTGNNTLAYAWYRKAAQPLVAYLYHGPLTLGTAGQASSAAKSWIIGEGEINYQGTATITGGSLSNMIADISITKNNVAAKSQMVVSALPSNGYDFNTPPTGLSSTSWSGTWSDRINTLGTALQFDASGGVNATTSETCLSSGTSFTWVAHPLYPGKNIF